MGISYVVFGDKQWNVIHFYDLGYRYLFYATGENAEEWADELGEVYELYGFHTYQEASDYLLQLQ